MSGITGIQSTGTDALQWLQQIQTQNKTTEADRPRGPAPPDGGVPEPLWEDIESSAASSGLTEEEVSALKDELKSAISTAMENVDMSAGPGSGHEAIDSAILATLQENGIDTTDVEAHMAEAQERMQNGPPPSSDENAESSTLGSDFLSLLGESTSSLFDTSTLLSSFLPLVDETA